MANDTSLALQDLYLGLADAGNDLQRLMGLAARLVGAEACSLMQADGADDGVIRMSVCASHGPLAAAALTASVAHGEGLAGQVLASGTPLVIPDIAQSPYAHLARRSTGGLIVVPVPVDGRIAGTLNASAGDAAAFPGPLALPTLQLIALYAGKAMHAAQLQGVLASRFAQLALLRDAPVSATAYRDPGRLARVLAKSFYREMVRAGFASGQIVQAATEIISELNSQLTRAKADVREEKE